MINKELWNTLGTMNPNVVSRMSLAEYNPKNHNYSLKIFNYECNVFPEERTLQYGNVSPPSASEFYLELSVINYLIGASDIPIMGQWVTEKQFPSGAIFFAGTTRFPPGESHLFLGRTGIILLQCPFL